MIERIYPPGIAAPRGPYSPGVRAGDYIFVSGQVPVDPATNQAVLGDIKTETRQVLSNIRRILEGCGASLADVVRCGVYLTDIKDFGAMNEVYAEVFGEVKPARTTISIPSLPLAGARIEIDAVAYQPRPVDAVAR